ncbi:hypothetical protein JN12_00202 [Geobacter argillaceus]|uniref:HTH cro/C1-type domain-containing protein n=1 Tax=Geobacter argillaceus TaxID=345631 RepID=A0A562WSE4_9BACT|nr:hypothetical protein JN12_00202 [Geobacter argillaceus]
MNHEELVDVSAAVTDAATAGTSRRRIAATGIADVFGIDLAGSGDALPPPPAVSAAKRPGRGKVSTPSADAQPSVAKPSTKAAPATSERRNGTAGTVPFPDPLTGDAIRAWRSSLGETQTEFAARCRITSSSISQWEKKGTSVIGVQSRTLAALRKAWKLTR